MKLILENWREYLKEQRNDVHIFFDMDGVLVDFAGKVAEEINSSLGAVPEELYSDSKSKRRALKRLQRAFEEEGRTAPVTPEELESMTARKDAGVERTKTEKRISDYLFSIVSNNPQIWIDMPLLPGAEEMVELAQQVGNVNVLTSPVDEASAGAKEEWVSNYFPELSGNVTVTREKGAHLQSLGLVEKGERAILIDDRTKYVNQFEDVGGEAVLHSAKNVPETLDFLRGLAR